MSRSHLLRRLQRLMAQVEALESVIDTRGLEALSDEELEALEAWHEEGEPERWEAWVAAWVASRPPHVVVLDGAPSEVEEELPLTDGDEEAPEPTPMPPESEEDEETPGETQIRRSTDLPESKAEERARLFELDTVRLAEPGDAPGSEFRRWLPPRSRRRRSRRC